MKYDDFITSIEGFKENYSEDINHDKYFGFPIQPILDIEKSLSDKNVKSIAYFSMEYGLAPSIYNSLQLKKPLSRNNQFFIHEAFSNYWLCDYLFKIKIDKMLDIPIYGGGLGVLAGDAMKSSVDLGFSIVGLGILWNKGYFKQNFWYKHGQMPEELQWDPRSYPGLIPLKNIIKIDTKEGPLFLRLWKYYVYSYDQKRASPLILMDSNLEENRPGFRQLTDQLYRSDNVWWKIAQRVILGVGGMKALDSLGYYVNCYHLNEGHAAFALVEEFVKLKNKSDFEERKKHFVYTCHTPVVAGHDRFRIKDVSNFLPKDYLDASVNFGQESRDSDQINLTYMCLTACDKVNAVAQKHGEVMRLQFPKFADRVKAITNGIHSHTWMSDSFKDLFDKYEKTFGDWRKEPENLSKAVELRKDENFRRDIFMAHLVNKKNLMNVVKRWQLKDNIFTIGWARRIAGYKRPSLIFQDTKQILKLAQHFGPIQIVLAGKAHPNDDIGSTQIETILNHIDELNGYKDFVKVLILENYDTYFGKLLTNSVDVWLNNPLPPFEASGTSGMKAIINGVLQLSTSDGWVVEAEYDDIGWVFGYRHTGSDIGREVDQKLEEDSQALYDMLREVVQLYYFTHKNNEINLNSPWIDKMINCILQSGFFNTQRMMKEYKGIMWADLS